MNFLFFQPLKDIAVVSGQTARFECIVQCDPHPNVFWTKNGQVIENDYKYQIEFRNGVCRMTIPQSYQGLSSKKKLKFSQLKVKNSYRWRWSLWMCRSKSLGRWHDPRWVNHPWRQTWLQNLLKSWWKKNFIFNKNSSQNFYF